MLGLPHISAKSYYVLAYHSSQPIATTLWPTTVPDTISLNLPSINYRVIIIPRHPHYIYIYIYIITCVFPNIFLSTHTTFHNKLIFNTISYYTNPHSNFMLFNTKPFQTYQYRLIITILITQSHIFLSTIP
jgi:hypothetical protein